jgi:hypothetical protein
MNEGAYYEIVVDGKALSCRDRQDVALEAARYLKSRNPASQVAVRDRRTNEAVPVTTF